jgi:hypothetical protein
MTRSLRMVFSGLAFLTLPIAAVSATASAAPPNKVTICMHTKGGDIQLDVSEQAAMRLWEQGLATFGACAP